MKLTIAIPTFDRNALLRESIRCLLRQATSDCQFLILDNGSPEPVEPTLAPLFQEYPAVVHRIIRNRVNVGAAANILRCFELCDTPWMWLLGDDDRADPSAIATIGSKIRENPDSCYITFSCPSHVRTLSYDTVGADAFAEKMDSFSAVLFISSGVYHVEKCLPAIRYGYNYSYSWAPHVAMLLAGLGRSGRCVFAAERIIEAYCLAPAAAAWSPIGPLLGKVILLDLPLSPAARAAIAEKLRVRPGLEFLTIQLLLLKRRVSPGADIRYLFDNICARLYCYQPGLVVRLKIVLYRLLIRCPTVGYWIVRAMYRIFGRLDIVRRNPLEGVIPIPPEA